MTPDQIDLVQRSFDASFRHPHRCVGRACPFCKSVLAFAGHALIHDVVAAVDVERLTGDEARRVVR